MAFQDKESDEEYSPAKKNKGRPTKGKGGAAAKGRKKKGSDSDSDEDWGKGKKAGKKGGGVSLLSTIHSFSFKSNLFQLVLRTSHVFSDVSFF